MPTLLVTGGCGFIGSNFIREQLATYPDQSILNIDVLTYAGNLENLADIKNDSRYTFLHGNIGEKAGDISQVGRNTQGVRVIRLGKSDSLVSIARIPADIEKEAGEENSESGNTSAV